MRRLFLIFGAVLILASCGKSHGTYSGPKVTRVIVDKDERKMYLMHGLFKLFPRQLRKAIVDDLPPERPVLLDF